MATKEIGFAHRKGAIAAARRVLGSDAVIDNEFEVFETEGGRYDWKAIERKRAPRRTSSKGNPFAPSGPSAKQVADAEAAIEANTKPDFGTITKEEAEAARNLSKKLKDAEPPKPDPQPEDDHKPSAAASAFGAFANGQLGNGHSKAADGKATKAVAGAKAAVEKKVRAPAVVQNGVRQPSAGTTCRAVWDELDRLRTENNGTPPDSKQVKKLAEDKKWNANNASIEFYQWRKFNGITGRSKSKSE